MNDTMRKNVNERMDKGAVQFDVVFNTTAAAIPRGPVGHFTLALDKAAPADVLSLCFPGDLKKISPTRFIATRENFTAPGIVRALFVATTVAKP
jgi:hypothetical protein